ncbi:MAG: class I SAM-dependent methyltransferase, partial [Bacteroidota bacterium]
MNPALLHPEVQEFISQNLKTDIPSLLLGKPPFDGISNKALAQQIVSKNKAKTKLPTWFGTAGIYYPPKQNLEQSSSERTAQYKASLVSGGSLADLTGGFGVDSYFFSKAIQEVHHCEWQQELSGIAQHNFKVLGGPITPHVEDGLAFLRRTTQLFDWIYVDPSRRDNRHNRVFLLADCEPNVPQHLDFLFSKADRILLKTSPLLDISAGTRELQGIKEIHIVAVHNEVKELLWVLEANFSGAIQIKTRNYGKTEVEQFDFSQTELTLLKTDFSEPKAYLYEPNAAILKSGAFDLVTSRHGVHKLHVHTHLYTSDQLLPFPGRQFQIVQTLPYSKRITKALGLEKANVAVRNFPETVAA